jgi:DNA-directed RNA polymerase specialized sigma24 family protein
MATRWTDCRTIDPTELETRFSTEDSIAFIRDIVNDEPSEESRRSLERIREIMEELPPREADFVDLYFFRHLKQTDIASIFRVSQPTVCYRLKRATLRIQFMLSLPDLTIDQIREAMEGFLSDPLDVEIMVLMYKTTCQSEVAKRLGVTQGLVRHRFMRATQKMLKNEVMEVYATVFDSISKNLNILREVQRPAWDAQVAHVVD